VLLRTDLRTAQREVPSAVGVLAWAGDGVLLFGQSDDLRWFASELARLPFAFEIRRPHALRAALAEHAQALLAMAAPEGSTRSAPGAARGKERRKP
jgi:hypothetical protein